MTAVAWPAEPEDLAVALSGLPMPGDWARLGRCRSAPPSLFFPARGDDTSRAVEICRGCPVLDECREYALAAPLVLSGIWGGTTGLERRRLKRAHVAQAATSDESEPATRTTPAAPGTLDRHLEQLLEHPGRWAKVAHFPSRHSAHATASLLRTGRRSRPPGQWQFEGRVADGGGSDLYAVYLGAALEEAAG